MTSGAICYNNFPYLRRLADNVCRKVNTVRRMLETSNDMNNYWCWSSIFQTSLNNGDYSIIIGEWNYRPCRWRGQLSCAICRLSMYCETRTVNISKVEHFVRSTGCLFRNLVKFIKDKKADLVGRVEIDYRTEYHTTCYFDSESKCNTLMTPM